MTPQQEYYRNGRDLKILGASEFHNRSKGINHDRECCVHRKPADCDSRCPDGFLDCSIHDGLPLSQVDAVTIAVREAKQGEGHS
ncbi:hypothetical protein PhaeoP18_01529 [Phaeobacter piscinae]|nr:hypothetical protein PhaeoP18_01529 [Phaeobacter piscinae]